MPAGIAKRLRCADSWQRASGDLGCDVLPGIANFLLCHLGPDGPEAATIVQRCQQRGLFVRNATTMSPRLGSRCLRIAVKDRVSNQRRLEILRGAMRGH